MLPLFKSSTFVSPQLELFELDEAEWQRAWLRPPYIHRQIQGPMAAQLPLWAWAGLLCFYLFSG